MKRKATLKGKHSELEEFFENLNQLKNHFDKLFLTGMIKHHEGALQMLTMISGSTNDEVKTLSENIATTQTIEIETMKAMLAGK